MKTNTYLANISISTNDVHLAYLIETGQIFGETRKNIVGPKRTLSTVSKENTLGETITMYRRLSDTFNYFIATSHKASMTDAGFIYTGALSIFEVEAFLPLLPQGEKDFLKIIPSNVFIQDVGDVTYHPHHVECTNLVTIHRGFDFNLYPVMKKNGEAKRLNFLESEIQIAHVMEYFKQYYG